MNGIASLLDQQTNIRVEKLWQELETRCGLIGAKSTPFPHLTWQVTEGYDQSRIGSILRNISGHTQPFIIHSFGLGIFTGEKPVLYISIFKEESLIRFHRKLWDQTQRFAQDPAIFYAPDQWVPHITLAYNDVNRGNLNCALQLLAFQSFEWEIKIDNLIYFSQIDNQTTETFHYKFND